MRAWSSITMVRHALMVILLFFLIVYDGCGVCFGWKLRKLAGADPKENKTEVHDSPSPTPIPVDKKADPKLTDETGNKNINPSSINNTQKVDLKYLNDTIPIAPPPLPKSNNEKADPNGSKSNDTVSASPPPSTKMDDDKSHEEEKKKHEGKTNSKSNTSESCDGSSARCTDQGQMVACILETGSKNLVVLVQNGGDGTIKVKLTKESNLSEIEVAEHQTKKIPISLTSSRSANLTLDAGNGNCVLPMDTPVPEAKLFMRLPSYGKLLTPVNGAYFLILTVLVFGGTWACCKLRKKRHDGVPYQELEMVLPETVSATDVETAEGWDQGWDDDWDEDMAVKTPGRIHGGSISANGLTSRSTNKDGWEDNWDD